MWLILILQDETMHSGADVDAFTAALNRDIEGDNNNSSLPSSQSQSQPQSLTSTDGNFTVFKCFFL